MSEEEGTRMTYDKLVKAGTEVLIAQGGAPGASIHSWRCEDRESYPEPCTCAEDVVTDILALLREMREEGASP